MMSGVLHDVAGEQLHPPGQNDVGRTFDLAGKEIPFLAVDEPSHARMIVVQENEKAHEPTPDQKRHPQAHDQKSRGQGPTSEIAALSVAGELTHVTINVTIPAR